MRFESQRDMVVEVSRHAHKKPKIATFAGSKFTTSTQLSKRILKRFDTENFRGLPTFTQKWLLQQQIFSRLLSRDYLLLETFPRCGQQHLVIYGFAWRNAQQTLGFLTTKQLEAQGLDPLGFVVSDYATLI